MVTSDRAAQVEGVKFLPNIRYGTPEHRAIFRDNDILVLPTKIDAYPQVIGEAAAAGLAVITTKYALGAREVIEEGASGYISDSQEGCVDHLLSLIGDLKLIDSFKSRGHFIMGKKFAPEVIRKAYLEALAG